MKSKNLLAARLESLIVCAKQLDDRVELNRYVYHTYAERASCNRIAAIYVISKIALR